MIKKLFLSFFVLAICGAFLNAQTLDEVILNAVVKISWDLPAGAAAAVIDFKSDSNELNTYVINGFHGAMLRNRRITSVRIDQERLKNIREGLHYNEAGELSVESAQEAGQLLGAQYLVTGFIESSDSDYKIAFNAIDTNAEILSQYTASLNPRNDVQLASLLSSNTPAAASEVPVETSVSQQESAANSQTEQTETEIESEPRPQTQAEIRREQRRQARAAIPDSAKKLNTVGVSIGTCSYFGGPTFITTVHGTYSPVRNLFLEAGLDLGLDISYYADDFYGVESYYSLYPFIHVGFFVPFIGKGGWYAGIGAGFMTGQYTFSLGKAESNVFAFDVIFGFNIMNILDISFTVRTDFTSVYGYAVSNGKLSIGYVYRF